MATHRPLLLLFYLLLLILTPPPRANGIHLGLGQWRTLISLSNSLMTRVANARAARGDHAGADRARKIAQHLNILGGGRAMLSAGWDFAWNYALRGGGLPTADIVRAASGLLSALGEAARMESAAERAGWALRNYKRLLSLSNSLFQSLLLTFSRPGPLREAMLVIQREAREGELIRDCVEVGAGDLEGLIKIAKEILLSASSADGEL